MADTKLGTVRSKTVLLAFWVAVDGFNHHRNDRSVAWIVPEALDGFSGIVQNDVIVVLQRRRCQGYITARPVAEHGDFIRVNAVLVIHLSRVHAEVTNGGTRVLNPAVGRVDQLVRALHLGAREWVPAEAVIHRCRDVSHPCEAVSQFHNGTVLARAERRAIGVLRQEITRVEQKNEWTAGEGVAYGLVHVHELRHLHGRKPLQRRNHRDVRGVLHVFRDLHLIKNFIQIALLCIQAKGQRQKQ